MFINLVCINDYQQVFLRPPYGAGRMDAEVVSVCREFGYVIAMWSSDPQGFRKGMTSEKVYERFMRDLSPGLILLLHTKPVDIGALPNIIRGVERNGYSMNKTLREGIPTTVYP